MFFAAVDEKKNDAASISHCANVGVSGEFTHFMCAQQAVHICQKKLAAGGESAAYLEAHIREIFTLFVSTASDAALEVAVLPYLTTSDETTTFVACVTSDDLPGVVAAPQPISVRNGNSFVPAKGSRAHRVTIRSPS